MEYVVNKAVDREAFFKWCLNEYIEKGELSKTRMNLIVNKYINFFKSECREYISLFDKDTEFLKEEINKANNEVELCSDEAYKGVLIVNQTILNILNSKLNRNKESVNKINSFMIYLISKEKEKLEANLKFIEELADLTPIKKRRI